MFGNSIPKMSDWRSKMIEIGRIAVKIAGRDAGKKCTIIDILDDKYVLIDGETRRRKVNILHIEPLNQVIKIEKNASHEEVSNALKELGIVALQTKPKPKAQKPAKKRKTPDQLRVQKEEKKKLRDLFKFKKKEEKAEAKETTLEQKAGLETKEEHKNEHPHEHKENKAEKKETKEKKPAKKTIKKK